jgi:hypothetical protein
LTLSTGLLDEYRLRMREPHVFIGLINVNLSSIGIVHDKNHRDIVTSDAAHDSNVASNAADNKPGGARFDTINGVVINNR